MLFVSEAQKYFMKSIITVSAFVMGLLFAPACKNTNEHKEAIISEHNADTISEDTVDVKLKLYKKDVLATYYSDKFNGRKTSSGACFDNKKYTAAHKTLPFGTKLRITNESNGKWVDVIVNDRGPFSKKLEIDLTKTAFQQIASNKNHGTFKVKIEKIED